MFWIPMAIGAAVGAVKNEMEAQQAADERKRQAAITRFSPWTGMVGHTVKDPSLVGNVTQGAAAGGSLGQAYNAYNAAPVTGEFAASNMAANAPNRFNLMNTSLNGSAGAMAGAGGGNAGVSLLGNNQLSNQYDPYLAMARMYQGGQ